MVMAASGIVAVLWCADPAPAVGGLLDQNIFMDQNTQLKVAYSFREEQRGEFSALLPLSHGHLQWWNPQGTRGQGVLSMAPCVSAPSHARVGTGGAYM